MKKEFVEFGNYKYELFHTLMKCDYTLLDGVIQKYKKILDKDFIKEWSNADDNLKKLTYCHLVKSVPSSMEMMIYAQKLRKEIRYGE